MRKRDSIQPTLPCRHEIDPTLWRLCADGTLRECTQCYEMQEVRHATNATA